MVGEELIISNDATASELVETLHGFIENLIRRDFQTYLNLLYRIDVSEKAMVHTEAQDLHRIAEHATREILKKEWQKIYFRNKNL